MRVWMELKKVKIKKNHSIKVLPEYFKEIIKGKKSFEIRNNDRDYKVGDLIVLKEFDGTTYTGREVMAEITYITDFAQQEGYVVFSFKKFSVTNRKDVGKFERGYKKGVL